MDDGTGEVGEADGTTVVGATGASGLASRPVRPVGPMRPMQVAGSAMMTSLPHPPERAAALQRRKRCGSLRRAVRARSVFMSCLEKKIVVPGTFLSPSRGCRLAEAPRRRNHVSRIAHISHISNRGPNRRAR